MSIRDLLKEAGDVNVEDAYPKTYELRERAATVGVDLVIESRRVNYISLMVASHTLDTLPQALANHEALLAAIGQRRPVVLCDEVPDLRDHTPDDVLIENIPLQVARAIIVPSARAAANGIVWCGESFTDNGNSLPARVNFITNVAILTDENGHRLMRTREYPSGIPVTLD